MKKMVVFIILTFVVLILLSLNVFADSCFRDDGNCMKDINGQPYYYNGSEYKLLDKSIKPSTYPNYINEMTKGLFKVYFRNNSNTAEAVRFEKNGYFFVY